MRRGRWTGRQILRVVLSTGMDLKALVWLTLWLLTHEPPIKLLQQTCSHLPTLLTFLRTWSHSVTLTA